MDFLFLIDQIVSDILTVMTKKHHKNCSSICIACLIVFVFRLDAFFASVILNKMGLMINVLTDFNIIISTVF